MFEQTFLNGEKTGRKPYSMLLSLMLQIAVIGALCAVPFVFTQGLPVLQLKSVLAAPPKPPVALKVKATSTRLMTETPRTFHLPSSLVRIKELPAASPASQNLEAAPEIGIDGGDPDGVPGGVISSIPGPPPLPQSVVQEKPNPHGPIRVGTISSSDLIFRVQPLYPPLAKASRVQGVVEFTALIGKDGTLQNLQLVRGHPLLVRAARDAVLQWRYRPTLLNGEPVEVITDILVNFTLNQ